MKLINLILSIFGFRSKPIESKIDVSKLSSSAENVVISAYEDTLEVMNENIIAASFQPAEELAEQTNNFQYSTPSSYPISLRTSISKILINYEEIENRFDKGVMEDYFYDHLIRIFPTKIFNNKKPSSIKYIPDFLYIDEENGNYIVIEIDEPYTINGGTIIPIHTKGTDDARNQFFLNNGWSVVRFAEEQVALYPDSCVKFLTDHINNTSNTKIVPIECWDDQIAQKLITERYRNCYLPFGLKDNEGVNSQTSYRSFKVISIFYLKEKDSIILRLRKNDNENYKLECWIDRATFKKIYLSSNIATIYPVFNLKFSLALISFTPENIELTAIGRINNVYFNANHDTIRLNYPDSTIESIRKEYLEIRRKNRK